MQVRLAVCRQNKQLTGPSNTLYPCATSVLSSQLLVMLLCRPELVAGSNHGNLTLLLTLLLLCHLHQKGIQGKVSLTVQHVTLICHGMFALFLSSSLTSSQKGVHVYKKGIDTTTKYLVSFTLMT